MKKTKKRPESKAPAARHLDVGGVSPGQGATGGAADPGVGVGGHGGWNGMPGMGAGQQGVGGVMGGLFGYGPQGGSAAQQLATQGVQEQYANINLRQGNQTRAQQEQNLGQLQSQATGTGPSMAQSQLASGLNQAQANQLSAMGATGYGGAPGVAAKRAAMTGSAAQAAGANQAAQIKAQEMIAGQNALTGATAGIRQQDLASATAQAQLEQSAMNQYQGEAAGLYGQEQGQEAQGGLALQKSLMNAVGGVAGLGAMARGGVVHHIHHLDDGGIDDSGTPPPVPFKEYTPPSPASGGGNGSGSGGIGAVLRMLARGGTASDELTFLGEHAPELLIHGHHAALVDHPVLTMLRGGETVVPLAKGSAPYRPGPLPHQVTPPPTRPSPSHVKVSPRAMADMQGKKPPAKKQPGITPLSPRSRASVFDAMRMAGIRPVR